MPDELVEVDLKDQKDQIVITIHETPQKELSVRSVDLFAPAMRMRLSTPTTDRIENVFHDDVAQMIRKICASATEPKQVINVPDFVVRFRGLAVRGYTLLVHTLEDGMRQFIVRLKRGVGNALALFRPLKDTGANLQIFGGADKSGQMEPSPSGRLFDEMLSHLYLPLVNLNNYLRATLEGADDGRTSGLDSSVVQLKTKAEMLQFAFDRVISEMMMDKYTNGSQCDNTQPALEDIGYARDFAKQRQTA